jgi:hypothetical protein
VVAKCKCQGSSSDSTTSADAACRPDVWVGLRERGRLAISASAAESRRAPQPRHEDSERLRLGLGLRLGLPQACVTIRVEMAREHISDEDLERYYLGMVTEESELALLEEHLLACSSCAERFEDAIRAAIIEGYDLE